MLPHELAIKISEFALERLGLLALELESNEDDAKVRIAAARSAHDRVWAAARSRSPVAAVRARRMTVTG